MAGQLLVVFLFRAGDRLGEFVDPFLAFPGLAEQRRLAVGIQLGQRLVGGIGGIDRGRACKQLLVALPRRLLRLGEQLEIARQFIVFGALARLAGSAALAGQPAPGLVLEILLDLADAGREPFPLGQGRGCFLVKGLPAAAGAVLLLANGLLGQLLGEQLGIGGANGPFPGQLRPQLDRKSVV